jgi:hypothetical protein
VGRLALLLDDFDPPVLAAAGLVVVDRTGGACIFDHPRLGRLRYQQIAFALANRPDFKLAMLVPEAPRKNDHLVVQMLPTALLETLGSSDYSTATQRVWWTRPPGGR